METKKQLMNERIKTHGEELIKFFNLPDQDPVKLSKALYRIENKAHDATTCLCNTNNLFLLHSSRGDNYQHTEEEVDAFFDKIRNRLKKYLGEGAEKCFINHDPRGYALKIKEEFSQDFYYKDFGGYGILAPDFGE